MRTDMRGRDFVTLQDFTGEEIQTILDVAFQLKRENAIGQAHELLKNKTLGMLFAQPSTRTRVSFETGMTQLGGHAQYYSEDSMQRKNKETWADTGLVLSRYLNALMVRLYDLEEYGMARDIMNEIRKNTTIPVINGLDDKEHPCQCMGDLMVIQEKLGAGCTPVKDQATALMEVAAGTADAAVIDALMAGAMVGEGTGYENLAYTVSLNADEGEQYGVGFRKGSDLTQKLNEFFQASFADGSMQKAAETYGIQAALCAQ